MQDIACFLDVAVKETRGDRKFPQYRIRTSTVKSHKILSNYFDNYPLQSSKYLDYMDWKSIIPLFELKIALVNAEKIEKVKYRMNNHRSHYN